MRSRVHRRQSGTTIVELALVMPVFLLIFLGLMEFGIMFFSNLSMQYAVREGARYAVTGQSNLDPKSSNQQRYAAVIESIRANSMGMYDKVSPVISVNGKTYNASQYSNGMFGAPGDIIVLQLDCDWTLVTPMLAPLFANGKYHYQVAATMRNEYFP
jgi:Flp pilus assembly protein TadG